MPVTKKSSAAKPVAKEACSCKECKAQIAALKAELAECKNEHVDLLARVAKLEQQPAQGDASADVAQLRSQLRQLVSAIKNRRGSPSWPQF